jgi:hypothetical protein
MSEQDTADASGPDPQREVGPEAAAEMLGFTVAHLLELVKLERIASRTTDDGIRISVPEIQEFREQYQRRRAAIREINQIVDETPGGWDA